MTNDDLRALLGRLPHTPSEEEPQTADFVRGWLYSSWSDAHAEAERAWQAWRRSPGEFTRDTYRTAAAAEDRAQDALARHLR